MTNRTQLENVGDGTGHRRSAPGAAPPDALRMSEVLAAMTYALDITEGQPEGHAVRTCLIGMGIAEVLGLDEATRGDLYYALLLKDLGCSSNAARLSHAFGAGDLVVKRAVKRVDVDNLAQSARFVFAHAGRAAPLHRRLKYLIDVSLGRNGGQRALFEVRCERGAAIARQMGFSEVTAAAIRALDERWNGEGHPYGVAGDEIPLLGRILSLSQTAEVFWQVGGAEAALRMARERAGRWFDPDVVEAFERAASSDGFWDALRDEGLEHRVARYEPAARVIALDEERLDTVAEAFARVIDAKSPWTYRHSERVRALALGAAAHVQGRAGLDDGQRRTLGRAALLHDIGKLGVSSVILDKRGALTDEEFAQIRRHPADSERILRRVAPFRELGPLAGGHHERLDGGGYHRGMTGEELGFEVRLLTVADQFEALTARRPYREPMSPERALEIVGRDLGEGVDPAAFAALERFLATSDASPLLRPQDPDPEVPIPGET